MRLTIWRFRVGRWLIHVGLRCWPKGRCQHEVTFLLGKWAEQVRRELAEASQTRQQEPGEADPR